MQRPRQDQLEGATLRGLLRCLSCGSELTSADGEADERPSTTGEATLECSGCHRQYPVLRGTPRMLRDTSTIEKVRRETAASFAYEWKHFGALRPEWERNFRDYLRPHSPESLRGRRVLDVGAGSGRHSAAAARHGAQVVAVDLGDSIDVARANLPHSVLTIQADAEDLPLAAESFDLVVSIGVLHHLPDPRRALAGITHFVRPGGHVHVYLYWVPERRLHRQILRAVNAARRVTTKLPHRLLHALCYPLSVVLWVGIVLPNRFLARMGRLRRLREWLPLQAYVDYPFGVLVNDQFDRFSAPLERRFTRAEVEALLEDCGLEDVQVIANNGWVGDGRKPSSALRGSGMTSPQEGLKREH